MQFLYGHPPTRSCTCAAVYYLQLRFWRTLEPRRERRSFALSQRMHNPIHLLQEPQTPLITRQPLPTPHLILPLRGPILKRLPKPKYMTHNLRTHATLRPQTRHGDDGGEDAAEVGVCRGTWRVGEESAVFAFDDEDGEVGVRLGEFGAEFGGEGVVDAVPEGVATGEDGVDVGLGEGSARCVSTNDLCRTSGLFIPSWFPLFQSGLDILG